MFIEILNPWRSGDYFRNNIKKRSEYMLLKGENKKKFDGQKYGNNIDEKQFENFGDKELNDKIKKAFNDYENIGYLIMEFNTFYDWAYRISFCDPMIGCEEIIFEFNQNEKEKNIQFTIISDTKFKAFFLKANNDYLILSNNDDYYQENDSLIYDILNI